MRATAERVKRETGLGVTFVLGSIEVQGQDGEIFNARGVYDGNGIVLQADNLRVSTDQIADHEIFHDKAYQTPGLVRAATLRIIEKYGREEFKKVTAAYVKRLRGAVGLFENATEEEIRTAMLDVQEDILADAYAGINAFSAHAERFQSDVEQVLEEMGIGRGQQTAAATDRTTGPPARYSFFGKEIPTYEELIEKPDIHVVDIRGEHTGRIAEWRKAFLSSETAKRICAAPVLNRDTGEHLFIIPKSFTHTFSNLGADQLALAEHLPEIVQEAVLTHGKASRKAPDDMITGVFTLFGAARTDAGIQPVKLKVKEYYITGQYLPQNIKEYLGTGVQPQTYASLYDGKVLVLESAEKEDASSSAHSTAPETGAADKYPSASSTISIQGAAVACQGGC